jgi:MoCo/4Fe-4S cofactor protein with predicted Tat translocation signal
LPAAAGRQWTAIEELVDDPAFQAWVDAEYPAAAEFAPTERRQFLKLMGASFALAGLTGCEKSPFVAALPYVNQPDDVTIGMPRYYATAVSLDGFAQPVIATTYSGRPTKLDGNPDPPVTGGASDVFMQAAVLGLYDPDRARGPTRHRQPATWKNVEAAIAVLRSDWASDQGEGLRLLIGPTTSPTLFRQIDALLKEFPKARLHLHEPVGSNCRRELSKVAYGQPLDLHYQLDRCKIVISFDDDLLGPGPYQLRNGRAFPIDPAFNCMWPRACHPPPVPWRPFAWQPMLRGYRSSRRRWRTSSMSRAQLRPICRARSASGSSA